MLHKSTALQQLRTLEYSGINLPTEHRREVFAKHCKHQQNSSVTSGEQSVHSAALFCKMLSMLALQLKAVGQIL
jgi:hypothetical protein